MFRNFIIASLLLPVLFAYPAYAADEVTIVVNTSAGTNTYSAPVLGGAPVTVQEAMQAASISYTASWFPTVPGYAAMIIDSEPASTNGQFGSSFWWACINGFSSAAGLQTFVKSGDQVEWSYVTSGSCPND